MNYERASAREVFRQNLNYYMKKKGIDQAHIVSALNITASTVSDWVNGKKYPRVDSMQRLADLLGVKMSVLTEDHTLPSGAIPLSELHRIRIVGTVRAGVGGLALEDPEGYEIADVRRPDDYFYLRVVGDSMAPSINEGDLALVRIQSDVESGELAVVVINGDEGTIKKVVKKSDGTIILQAFNPEYDPRIFSGRALSKVHIAGKVVKTIRNW